jgi:hypothetical protein
VTTTRSAHRAVVRPTRKAAKIAAWAALPAALLLSGAVVAGGSYSAFSATTANPTSNWTTGTVVLSDDDAGSALFTATNLKPGSTGSNCITVTSTGSLASAVKLYATAAAGGTLGSQITLTVEQGTSSSATTFGSCANFTSTSTLYSGSLTSFGSTYTSYSNSVGSWTPTGSGSENRVYKFTYSLPSNLANSYQNTTASLGFTWEAQNS